MGGEGEGGGVEFFFKIQLTGGGGRNFKISVNIGHEWKKTHKCLILMLNLKVSKQTNKK